MTPEYRKELKGLAANASPGPWDAKTEENEYADGSPRIDHYVTGRYEIARLHMNEGVSWERVRANAAFIADARDGVDGLFQDLEASEEREKELRQTIEDAEVALHDAGVAIDDGLLDAVSDIIRERDAARYALSCYSGGPPPEQCSADRPAEFQLTEALKAAHNETAALREQLRRARAAECRAIAEEYRGGEGAKSLSESIADQCFVGALERRASRIEAEQ